ncbi:formyltetrahydrofolate deformylase [Ningiella sp. W23]|uniref:formyltetrahydrofolate deformylase n=1 Tax=Ningiella sp. W23 TaxID=3023715 RepID=UPI0037580A6A
MSLSVRLVIDCPDQVGLVAAVSQFLAAHRVNILEASHHTDQHLGRFFMRHEIAADSIDVEALSKDFADIANTFEMNWSLSESGVKQNVVLLASHESHCLNDVLHRWHTGELDCNIPCIIANHEKMRQYADWYKVPFHYVDFSNKAKAFTQVDELFERYHADVSVLARFMQIIPPDMCKKYAGKIINIHHSFLPSFAGAKPYQQAYDRGVKLIGATCHYVTSDLDEGPIIEQEVMRISHSDSAKDMVRKGKRCEINALANGLRYHLEKRVIICEHKTVVFD